MPVCPLSWPSWTASGPGRRAPSWGGLGCPEPSCPSAEDAGPLLPKGEDLSLASQAKHGPQHLGLSPSTHRRPQSRGPTAPGAPSELGWLGLFMGPRPFLSCPSLFPALGIQESWFIPFCPPSGEKPQVPRPSDQGAVHNQSGSVTSP